MKQDRKHFIHHASSANAGDLFRIKKAGGWARFEGWHSYRWIDVIFVSFDGKEVVFEHKTEDRNIFVKYSQIKTGEVQIIWKENDVFHKTLPLDLETNNIVKMWNPGTLSLYK